MTATFLTADAILEARPNGWPALLRVFARPVNPALIKQKPGRGNPEYVAHHTLRQYLHLAFDYTTIRTLDVVDKGDGKYGLRCELTCALGDDVRTFHGWGESDNTDYPLKSAESDAFRRICGMDLGLGLALWARETAFLASAYQSSQTSSPSAVTDAAEGTSPPPSSPTGEGVDGGSAAPPTADPHPTSDEVVLDESDRKLRRTKFMACLKGMGLDYEKDVKPYLIGKHGGSWSELPDVKVVQLTDALFAPPSRAEKEERQQKFAKAVREFGGAA